jgi:hypothetical protein
MFLLGERFVILLELQLDVCLDLLKCLKFVLLALRDIRFFLRELYKCMKVVGDNLPVVCNPI